MRPSVGFLLRVLALVGLLFALWSFAGFGDAYGRAVVAVASPIMRLASGFSLERIDATRIVVAHRLSTIAHADRIVVMDRGTIDEEGTFDELMSRDGLFRTLARRQMLVPA